MVKRIYITTFLSNLVSAKKQSCLYKKRLICFSTAKGQSYPLLFFSLLFERLRNGLGDRVFFEVLDLSGSDVASHYSKLEMSFLGQQCCYFLKGLDVLDVRRRKEWVAYLRSYAGPHQLIFYIPEAASLFTCEPDVDCALVDITTVDRNGFFLLARSFDVAFSKAVEHYIRHFFMSQQKMGLDAACLALRYVQLVGGRKPSDITMVLERACEDDTSLFMLAGNFLAKRSQPFFTSLALINKTYPAQFWVSFWSEQLWRAYYYIFYKKENNYKAAKTIGFRLPFSFLQRDWKKLSLAEVKQAHTFLYEADFRMKNGGSDFSLDVFYTRFFNGGFDLTNC